MADDALPVVCQATGQLTCTSLADTGESGAFPNNTSTVFSNIFDSSSDFATVQYLGLSAIMLTTPPPTPPTVVSIAAIFDPSTTISASSELTLAITTPTSFLPGPLQVERIVINFDFNTFAIPQFGIGNIIRGPTDIQELQHEARLELDGQLFVPIVSIDPSSTLSNISIGSPTSVMVEETVCSGYTVPANTAHFESYSTPPRSDMVIIPSVTFTPDNVSALVGGFDYSGTWRAVHIGTPWSYSPAKLEFNLIANLSDSTTVPLGTYSVIARAEDWFGPPPSLSTFNGGDPGPGQRWRWCIGGPVGPAQTSPLVTPLSPIDWNFGKYGTNVANVTATVATFKRTWTGSSPSVGSSGRVGEWYYLRTNLVGGPPFYSIQPSPQRPLVHRRLCAGGPYKSHANRRTLVKHDRLYTTKSLTRAIDALSDDDKERLASSITLYAAPIATYDNLLQILSNELETDRLAGSNSAQVLAVVPINTAELIANGFLYIPIPVNEFVWRKLSDIHIKAITFELYNGAGAPPSYLEDNAFVVTLQLRYK
jgi:hypothetical protein